MDKLDREAIESACGARITVLELTDSTNNAAKELAASGAPNGTTVLAEKQSHGRGRRGRSFVSAGEGLYMSVVLRPAAEPSRIPLVTAAAAVAVRDALLSVCGADCAIKWVNDLYFGGKKVCGILAESVSAAPGEPLAVVVGIGINFAGNQSDLPEELRDRAGFIFNGEPPISRNALAAEIIKNLIYRSAQLDSGAFLDEYRAHCFTLGTRVDFYREGRAFTADALSVDDSGALVVRLPDGSVESLNSGEITAHKE